MVPRKPSTVDEYLAPLPADKRAALERLRKQIHTVAPRAEECISYGVPAFRLDGRMLVWFAAAARHCSFFPGAVVQAYPRELKNYDTSKGTVRFSPDTPLPMSIVRLLVKARMAATSGKGPRRPR